MIFAGEGERVVLRHVATDRAIFARGAIRAATGQVLGVHDCRLDVAQGEIVVLMGLSGSGKSTLLRAVNALNPVCRGEVRLLAGNRMVSVTRAAAHPGTERGVEQR